MRRVTVGKFPDETVYSASTVLPLATKAYKIPAAVRRFK
jgi:hypothetical protein